MNKPAFEAVEVDQQPIFERYILFVNYNEQVLDTREELINFARCVLADELGDEVDVDSVTVKRPKFVARGVDKVLKRTPQAKIRVVTKF